MKYAILFAAVAVIAAILFVACSKPKNDTPSNSNPESKKLVDIGEGSSGKTIHVLTGETIRLRLRSNPSTGFSWTLNPPDKQILESNESEFESDPHKEFEAGYGGNEAWTFQAVGTGEAEISLVYARPWEKDVPSAKTFRVKVVVDAASPQAAVSDAANTLELTGKDNGRNIEVHPGDIIRIRLESNITTGYRWEHADKIDTDILKLDRNDYVSDPNPEELDGVGGRTVIVYRALKPGKTKIELTYMRPWEADSEFDEKYGVTVEVLEK